MMPTSDDQSISGPHTGQHSDQHHQPSVALMPPSASPLSSRDTSPARMPSRPTGPTERAPPRSTRASRKSSADPSPSRGPSLSSSSGTIPSAASIQRALSSTTIPNLPPVSAHNASKNTRIQKSAHQQGPAPPLSTDTTHHWPVSPRLKSPPPSHSRARSRRNSLRNQPTGTDTLSIIVQSSSPASSSRLPVKDEDVDGEDDQTLPTMKSSARGASGTTPKLETVQEASLPTTAGFDGLDKKASDGEHGEATAKVTEDLSAKAIKHAEGVPAPQNQNWDKPQANQRPHHLPSKPSLSSLPAVKPRTDTALKNMTVETETVSSIPQSVLGNTNDRSSAARGEPSGSLRLKPSTETIRPKKDKQKKTQRKAPSIHSSTVSSKADIFEAKVASAVDEANSSDSDETFVYESNPPEPQPHRSRHSHHSRTPSMTSITSLADSRATARDAHKIAGKKSSMKFANNPYMNLNSDPDVHDRPEGAIRTGSGRISGGSHHHHIGRHGQTRGGLSYVSVLDSDPSLPPASKSRISSRQTPSQPNSPRSHLFRLGNGNSNGNKKHVDYSTYDVDTENAADDERTPLVGAVPGQRTRTPRRPGSASVRQIGHQRRRNRGWCRGFAGCLVLSVLLLVLISSAIGLIMSTTKELLGVGIYEIRNVIASEDEIMLDMVVDAVNPNIIGVTISDMDVNIFAKSKHVGSDKWWWHPRSDLFESAPQLEGIDEGTDPVEDPDIREPRTMLLGRIFHFDSPLNFDGLFFKHRTVESMGEVRLTKPGNKTEAGGAERWAEVLQYPFELIVRGVFKYQLPLSTREHSVPITASYFYDPDEEKKVVVAKTKRWLSYEGSSVVMGGPSKGGERASPLPPPPWGRWDARVRSFFVSPSRLNVESSEER